jgi:hypothetical protein
MQEPPVRSAACTDVVRPDALRDEVKLALVPDALSSVERVAQDGFLCHSSMVFGSSTSALGAALAARRFHPAPDEAFRNLGWERHDVSFWSPLQPVNRVGQQVSAPLTGAAGSEDCLVRDPFQHGLARGSLLTCSVCHGDGWRSRSP